MKKPLFSVIIPTYNSAKTISKAVKSVQKQTYENWELIIVDDGSNDNTKELLMSFLSDLRIEYCYQYNTGVSAARNYGISLARGEYIVFLDSDDELENRALELYKRFKKADYIIGGYCILNKRVTITPPDVMKELILKKNFLEMYGEFFKRGLTNSPWAKCYRKSLINNLFNENLSIGEDLIFNLNFLENVTTVGIINEPVYRYSYQVSGSLSSAVSKSGFDNIYGVYEKTLEFITKNEIQSALHYIHEKFALDIMVLFERNIRFNEMYDAPYEIRNKFELYNLKKSFSSVSLKEYSGKWEIARKMLGKGKINLFVNYIRFIDFIRRKSSGDMSREK